MLERDEGAKEDEEEREVPMKRVGTGRTDVKRIAIKSWKTTAAARAPSLKQVKRATNVRPEGSRQYCYGSARRMYTVQKVGGLWCRGRLTALRNGRMNC